MNMENAILEMQKNLDEGHFIAFVSANEDPYCAVMKSDELNFPDNKTVVIRKKGGKTTIINLNLIIEVCIRRFGQYA
ncbi:hypothetical protein [uncultured Methanobrevibacter sp.]|uniref:hypothetical protein n=1 Tax=uncultured Methanobrevibacter sp. TaxID=253161 RepID=UPI0025E27026|nr:hypothetical protein [uncultured Methanobrevibacter sp.]